METPMNKQRALEILGIEDTDRDTIKKAYRSLALLYHPDKNPAKDANERFQEIHSAYVYLSGTEETTDYKSLLQSFLKNWRDQTVLYELLQRILLICEEKALDLMERIDKHVLKTIYELINNNKEVLHVSIEFIHKIENILKTKFENDERIVLHPFLDDLENIYKLTVDEEVYLVPLWHHHLIYDAKNGREIYVDCYPLLPESMWIDEYNHVHIEMIRELKDIWEKECIEVDFGSRKISFLKEDLRMKETQIIICKEQGINMIHPTNTYDILEKSDVYIHITILQS
jgi:hypothetical protein